MIKRFTYTLTMLFVMFGMLGVAAPAYALGDSHVRALKGTIVAINSKTRTLTVARPHATPVKVIVARGTLIKRNGKLGNFSKLRVGDKTSLRYNPITKRADEVDDTPGTFDIHGTIQAVDPTASTVTIASDDGGNSVTLNVDSTTVIERNGAPVALTGLVIGDLVEATYDSATMLASEIKAESGEGEVQGTISAIDSVANTVTITPDGGGSDSSSADVVLQIDANTVIISNDNVITLADLQVGNKVQAVYDPSKMVAYKIEVDNSSTDQ